MHRRASRQKRQAFIGLIRKAPPNHHFALPRLFNWQFGPSCPAPILGGASSVPDVFFTLWPPRPARLPQSRQTSTSPSVALSICNLDRPARHPRRLIFCLRFFLPCPPCLAAAIAPNLRFALHFWYPPPCSKRPSGHLRRGWAP